MIGEGAGSGPGYVCNTLLKLFKLINDDKVMNSRDN